MRGAQRIGIDCLSVFGLPPTPFIELAAELSCHFITLGVPITFNPEKYPAYCLKDPRTQRKIRAALRDHGVAVKVGEGFFFLPGTAAQDFVPHLDAMAEIGAQTINMVSMNGDLRRSLDAFAELAEMSAARGMTSSVEFVAGQIIGTLEQGVEAVRHIGRPDFKLVVDMLHFVRSGGSVADLEHIDANTLGYIQLCDCRYDAAMDTPDEALYERMCPGTGELPLLDMLASLPRHLSVGIEIPQRSLALTGSGPRERLTRCVEAARALLMKVDVLPSDAPIESGILTG